MDDYLSRNFPGYDCDIFGNVYKHGEIIRPFKSNKYLQVCLFDINHNKKVVGVHSVIAMKYLKYFDGCVVHHKDGNTKNNSIGNLLVMSRKEHSSHHGKNNISFINMNRGKAAWNRGMKMSDEFKRHCSESAKLWHAKKKRGDIAV